MNIVAISDIVDKFVLVNAVDIDPCLKTNKNYRWFSIRLSYIALCLMSLTRPQESRWLWNIFLLHESFHCKWKHLIRRANWKEDRFEMKKRNKSNICFGPWISEMNQSSRWTRTERILRELTMNRQPAIRDLRRRCAETWFRSSERNKTCFSTGQTFHHDRNYFCIRDLKKRFERLKINRKKKKIESNLFRSNYLIFIYIELGQFRSMFEEKRRRQIFK